MTVGAVMFPMKTVLFQFAIVTGTEKMEFAKTHAFGRAVNVTLGLPIVRTSVDHGTAFDIAGQGRADAGSLVEAVRVAVELARNEKRAGGVKT